MILWLDAQLPPSLAPWLEAHLGITAKALRKIGLRDAGDTEIFLAARLANAVVVRKDSNFVDLVRRLGPPPSLIWGTVGNLSNDHLRRLFSTALPDALSLLAAGTPIVELADKT